MAYVSSYLHRSCRLPRCCCVLDGQEAPYRPRALSFSAASGLPHPMGSRGIGAGKSVDKYVNDPARYWDQFYRRHDNKFYKDRHYLVKDWGRYFSETNEKEGPFAEPKVGCGADKMPMVLQNIKDVLKPGGCVLFRDYAVKDFAQCVYYSEDSISRLFKENGFGTLEVCVYCKQIQNRSPKILMDRRWIRAAFRCQGIHDFRQVMCQRSHQEDLGVRNA